MRLVESLRARPLLAMALLGIVIGSGLGVLHPIAPSLAQRDGNELAWQLPPPSVVPRFDDKQFAAVSSRRIWGAVAAGSATGGNGADGKPKPQWRLTGIILQPVPMALVLADGSTAVARVAVGEALPDGDRLLAVAATGITYQHDGCTQELGLYRDPTAQPEADCATQSDAPMPEANNAEAH